MPIVIDDASEAKPVFSLAFVQSRLEARALADPEFRRSLLLNAGSAFREMTGFGLPAGFGMIETDGRVELLIPADCYKQVALGVGVIDAKGWRMVVRVQEPRETDSPPK